MEYGFLIKTGYVDNSINEILKNVSNIEQIKKFVNENLNKSKILLKDIESVKEIEEYEKEMGYSYFSNFLEKENSINISFRNIDYYPKNSLMIDNYTSNYDYPIVLCEISKKSFFINFLDNIEILIMKIVQYLKDNITFKKHLIQLNEIEQFLRHLNFSENIFYGYSYNFEQFEQFPKFFKLDYSKFENTPKNIYKFLKHSFLKILNCIYKIIEQNVL